MSDLRAAFVIDYQNVHLTGAGLFEPHQPPHEHLVHPLHYAKPDCRLPEPTPTTRFSPRCRNQGAGVPRASIRGHRPSILRAQLGPESRMGARFKGEGNPSAAAI